jgi:hypothetical protein
MTSGRPKPRQKPEARSRRRELIARYGRVKDWDISLYVHGESRHGMRERTSMQVLEVRGDLDEAVKKVQSFRLTVFAKNEPEVGTAEIPSVGSVISMRQELGAAIELAAAEFQLAVAMAAAGRLRSVHLCFQEPRYGSALIASCSFSSRHAEEEEG